MTPYTEALMAMEKAIADDEKFLEENSENFSTISEELGRNVAIRRTVLIRLNILKEALEKLK